MDRDTDGPDGSAFYESGFLQDLASFDHDADYSALADQARRQLEARRQRSKYLPAEFFGEPAWDMLLDLFVAHCESKRISISSACIASGGSATTALRWLARLEALRLIERCSDSSDRRRIFVRLTPLGKAAIVRCMIRSEGM